MGPKDLIKIPCAKPREGRASIEVVEQSPRLMLLGRVREAIHIGEMPLLITGLTNNGVDVIGEEVTTSMQTELFQNRARQPGLPTLGPIQQ